MRLNFKLVGKSLLALMLLANVAFAASGNYIVNTNSANLLLRSGPGSNYKIKARMPKGCKVYVHSVKGNWAYITYNGINGYATMKYLKADSMNAKSSSYNDGSSYSNKVGSLITNVNGYWYSNSVNPFSRGQCTWYAFGRFGEVKNWKITFSKNSGRHAKYWYNLINNCAKGTTIQPKCVAVRQSGGKGYGHVVFVEDVDNKYVYYTDANAGKPAGTVRKMLKSTFLNSYRYFIY